MLQDHSHPKVRQEVQKTLLQFNDPGALVMLLRDLDAADFDVRMGAIRLAEKHHTPQILSKLQSIVETGGFSSDELELKIAAVRTLAAVGDPACLPSLERVLRGRNFFRAGALNQLKDQIVSSLGAFSSPEVHELLQQVSAFGSRELAQKAKSVAESMGRNRET
jgi:HEAT repeat protein